jgi:simple sugar transport system permease protein
MDWPLIFTSMVRTLPMLPMYSAPVAFAALGETVAQRSGILNIGLEGMMLLGAYVGMIASLSSGSPWIGVIGGILVGILLAMVSAFFCIRLVADQVVVGTAINLLALGVTSTLFRLQFGASGQLLSVPKIPSFGGFDLILLLLVVLVPMVAFGLYRTTWGLVLRSAGEYPKAAEAAGYSVAKLRWGALAIAGALAGLAGAYLSLGISGSFAENMTGGRGFVAIAMVTFGRWRPGFVFAATLLVGFAESLQYTLQASGVQAPYQLMLALPYLLAILVLVLVGRGTQAPGALGAAYRREE